MKIQRITDQSRRDFTAVYECEGCGAVETSYGYDDSNFHQRVIPNMVCKSCGKTSVTLGVDIRPLATRYPDGQVV